MKTLRIAAALTMATLACPSGLVLAQDEAKTEAAKLASESRTALAQLTGSVPLAAELSKTARAILSSPR